MSSNNDPVFDWSVADEDFPADQMNRAEHARKLTRFLVQKGQEANYVLNINAKWGTGKTYFMRRWVRDIGKKYPAVYIDAWSSDHSGDPLLSVVSGVKQKLHELSNISTFEQKLFSGLAKVAKSGAPALVKALINGQLKKAGLSTESIEELFSSEEIASAGAALVEQAVKAHDEASKGVSTMKESIQQWLSSVVEKNEREYPLFIFIDELDRCRPTYAIEMLETIKHIFDMQNVVFVIATDKEQLQHSIRAIYGSSFDSRLYLDRFFTRSVSLNDTSRKEYLGIKVKTSQKIIELASDESNFAFLPSEEGRIKDIISLLANIADGMRWPLRTVNLWFDRLESALIMSDKKLEIIMLSFLLALETDNSLWIDNLINNRGVFRDARSQNEERLDFTDFKVDVRWSFTLASELIDTSIMSQFAARLDTTYFNTQGIIAFLTHLKKNIEEVNANIKEDVRSEINYYLSNGSPNTVVYSGDVNGPFPTVIYTIYNFYHKTNRVSMDDYYHICKYSSLMS